MAGPEEIVCRRVARDGTAGMPEESGRERGEDAAGGPGKETFVSRANRDG